MENLLLDETKGWEIPFFARRGIAGSDSESTHILANLGYPGPGQVSRTQNPAGLNLDDSPYGGGTDGTGSPGPEGEERLLSAG